MTAPVEASGRSFDLLLNPLYDPPAAVDEDSFFGLRAHARALSEISSWPGYEPTPLRALPGLARRLRVGSIHYKDEAGRFGLGSFKALGGAYGVFRVVAREVARRTGGPAPGSSELRAGVHRDVVAEMTVTCATDGNHGRAVAWGAELVGCRAVIFIPGHVTGVRAAAIASHGAEVIRVDGSYDEAVALADGQAREEGRIVISDTAYPGYEEIPRTVMEGYTVLAGEIVNRWPEGATPTHLFVQAGVGGLAAAVLGHLHARWGPGSVRGVVVEPEEADGLFRSARAGEPRAATGSLETVMAGLSCREVSTVAWPVLCRSAPAFLRVADAWAPRAMRVLAEGNGGDPPVVAGESGAAGLAGLLAVSADEAARARLDLDGGSRALLLGTEGATDPGRYRELTGRDPEAVGGKG